MAAACLRNLFHDAAEVVAMPHGGGWSGALLYTVQSKVRLHTHGAGHPEKPSFVKIQELDKCASLFLWL